MGAIIERVLDAMWIIYNKKGTKEEYEKQLGIDLPDISVDVPYESNEEEKFRNYIRNKISI